MFKIDSEERVRSRLFYCLRIMHSFGLIHKDIKPANIAYSPSLGELVILDFGVSTFAKEEPGMLSETFREGTLKYMCPEMKKIGTSQAGFVDLYYNDVHSLELTIIDLLNLRNQKDSINERLPEEGLE